MKHNIYIINNRCVCLYKFLICCIYCDNRCTKRANSSPLVKSRHENIMKYFPGAIRSGVIKLYRDVTLDTFFNHNRLQSKLNAKGVIHHMIGRILTCEQDL